MKSIKVKILGPVVVLAVLVLVTSVFSILGAGNIEKKGRVISDQYLATIQDVSAMSKNTQTLMRLSYNYILAQKHIFCSYRCIREKGGNFHQPD